VVHPLVLLSVTDHHARSVARGSSKRVVGVLLGQDNGKSINVANSFGIPFEEDDKDAKTWFLDHNYVEGMFEMFKKVNGALPRCLPACCNVCLMRVLSDIPRRRSL
jgi:26S proteasome regulatory subunit N8